MLQVLLLLVIFTGLVRGQRYSGSITLGNAGLVNIFEHDGGSGSSRYSILASTYDTKANTLDKAYVLLYPGQTIGSNFTGFQPDILYNQLVWGKEISQVPSNVFGFDSVISPCGSTITGKTKGQLFLTDVRDFNFPLTYDLTTPVIPDLNSYMYSEVLWISSLGGEEILTCRAQYSSGSLSAADFVYFKRPALGSELSLPWSPTVLKNDTCDTNLAQLSLKYGLSDNWELIYATGFYTQNLALIWPENDRGSFGDWTNPDEVQTLVLDSGRQFYDVHVADVNNDGDDDVIASVVANNGGSVEVWDLPQNNFRDIPSYTKHIVASGFVSRVGGAGGRTPGVVKTFYPTNNQDEKPYILIAGADDGRAYYLVPNSSDPADWSYTQSTLVDYGAGQTVSGVAAADLDGDGYTEIFVSVHNLNRVDVYTFAP